MAINKYFPELMLIASSLFDNYLATLQNVGGRGESAVLNIMA